MHTLLGFALPSASANQDEAPICESCAVYLNVSRLSHFLAPGRHVGLIGVDEIPDGTTKPRLVDDAGQGEQGQLGVVPERHTRMAEKVEMLYIYIYRLCQGWISHKVYVYLVNIQLNYLKTKMNWQITSKAKFLIH